MRERKREEGARRRGSKSVVNVADFQTSRKPYSCRRTGSFDSSACFEKSWPILCFVSSGVQLAIVGPRDDRNRGFCQPRRLTSGRTCIKHDDVTVRRHLTAAGRALERVKVTARRLFQVCVQNGGDVHFRRARTPMIIDCTFEHLPTTDR